MKRSRISRPRWSPRPRTNLGTRKHRRLTFEPLDQRQMMSGLPVIHVAPLDGPDAYEPDNLAAQARTIGTNGYSQRHSIHTFTDMDWVKFTLTETSGVAIKTSGFEGDTEMWLYGPNSSTNLIAHDNDSGVGSFSRIERDGEDPLAAGTYYVKVAAHDAGFADNPVPAYYLSVKATPGDGYECDKMPDLASTIATDGSPQTHSLHTPTDVDWVKFTLTQTSNVMIQTSGPAGDTEMRLYGPDSSASLIEYDNNDGPGAFSCIERSGNGALAAGTYYVKVNEYGSNSTISSYSIQVMAAPGDAYEVDDTPGLAKTILTGGAETLQTHTLHAGTDVDWVKFTLSEASNVVVYTTGSEGDTEMWLYGPNSSSSTSLIEYDNDDGVGAFSFIARSGTGALAPGTYYVKVGEYGGDDFLCYEIGVWATSARDGYEVDNTVNQAKTITPNGAAQAHSLHVPSDVDWVKFTLDLTSNVMIETNGPSGDTVMRLYGPGGLTLLEDDNDDGPGAFSRIDRSDGTELEPGTYYVKVRENGSNAAIPYYTIRVTATPSTDYFLYEHWGGTWCDAEKIPGDDGAGEPTGQLGCDDDYMCWAAAGSNVLEWTGWGDVELPGGTPITTCDDMFEYFQDHWTDNGGFVHHAWEWWFTGKEHVEAFGWDPSSSDVDVIGAGFYLRQDFDAFCHVSGSDSQAMAKIEDYLRSGWGVGLHILKPGGGHAITCWGYEFDPATGNYLGIYVTDSDDDKYDPTPEDDLRYYDVAYQNNRWYLQGYGMGGWHITDVLGLERRPAGVLPNTETTGGGGGAHSDDPPNDARGLAALDLTPIKADWAGQSRAAAADLLLAAPDAIPTALHLGTPKSVFAEKPALVHAALSAGTLSATIPANSREHGLMKKTGEAALSLHLDAIWAGEKEEQPMQHVMNGDFMEHTRMVDHLLADHHAWS